MTSFTYFPVVNLKSVEALSNQDVCLEDAGWRMQQEDNRSRFPLTSSCPSTSWILLDLVCGALWWKQQCRKALSFQLWYLHPWKWLWPPAAVPGFSALHYQYYMRTIFLSHSYLWAEDLQCKLCSAAELDCGWEKGSRDLTEVTLPQCERGTEMCIRNSGGSGSTGGAWLASRVAQLKQ